MAGIYDLARMYSLSTGDSDIVLTTAVPGCKTFDQAGVSDSEEINYGIITYDTVTHRPTGTEVGVGKYITATTTLQRTTVLSSISLDSDDTEDAAITLSGLSEVYIPWLTKDVLRIKESDSDPNVYPVNTIVVSNGTLTDNGSGQVTLTTGGGGGGSLTAMFFAASTETSITNTSSRALLTSGVTEYDGTGTDFATWDSDTQEIVIDTAGYYLVNYAILVQASTGNLGNGHVSFSGAVETFDLPCNNTQANFGFSVAEMVHFNANDTIYINLTNNSGVTIQATANTVGIMKFA